MKILLICAISISVKISYVYHNLIEVNDILQTAEIKREIFNPTIKKEIYEIHPARDDKNKGQNNN